MRLAPSLLLLLLLLLAPPAAASAATAMVPQPTAPQLAWQRNEIMALIHFNMATFFQNGDPGCNAANWAQSQKPSSFAPAHLNVSNWIASMRDLGVKEAVLTAKHGCGFLLWNTSTKLPSGEPYSYHVPDELNVLQIFSDAMEEAGIGHGFYYSLTNNMYLNVHSHYVKQGALLPGQQKVTQQQFEAIALAQVTELWTRFGSLNEIWFDGGYTSDMQKELKALLKAKQPGAIGYNGGGISANPARWSKTEGDVPPGPGSPTAPGAGAANSSGVDVWSTGCNDTDWGASSPPEDCADPSAALFYPSGTDYTLQSGDVWFYEPASQRKETEAGTLRTLDELIYTYHQTVGHNTNLELDFAIDRNGQVQADHAALYKRFGDWIRSCYGQSLAEGATVATTTAANSLDDGGSSGGGSEPIASVRLSLSDGGSGGEASVFDRVVLTEDQTKGQIVRGWSVEWSPDSGAHWEVFGHGRSIGNKRIVLAKGAMSHVATDVRLNITGAYGGTPHAVLKVHAPCLTGTIDTIRKIGTEDIGMTETTPIVFKDKLYRFESLRSGNWNNTYNCTNTSPGEGRRCVSYLRLRSQSGPPEWKTGEIVTKPFGFGYALGCAIVEKGGAVAVETVHVFGTGGSGGKQIGHFSSTALTPDADWKQTVALELPGKFGGFNTAVGKGILPNGEEGYAMLIEVGGLPGGFNIIVALAKTLEGPWSLTSDDDDENGTAPSPPALSTAPSSASSAASSSSVHGPYAAPQHGYCARAHATPTHSNAGLIGDGKWPVGVTSLAAAEAAVGKICDANVKCAAFGLGTDNRAEHSYQLYPASPTVLAPLETPDWTLFYKNATCCVPPPPPPPPPALQPARVFGPGSCPCLRYDKASGYWHMLYTPNPTVSGGDYRTWQIYAARSKTLATGSWEKSTLNPVMEADAFDRQIHNTDIPVDEQGWAANTTNLNDSDPDLVEFEGKVLFVGNWGDQRTTPTNSLFQAVYDGTMEEFWASLYPTAQ